MKKLLTLTLSLTMLLTSLVGCGSQNHSQSSTPTPSVQETYIEISDTLAAEQYGIGFRNEDIALGLEVQRLLDEMIADGTAVEISKKWFGTDALLRDQAFLEETVAPEGDDSLTKILEKKTLIVGLDDSYPPMGFRDDNNNIVGFDIDLATEVAKRMGVEVVFQPIDWDSKELELSAGKIDCIWNGMTITDGRLENMFFTKAYIANEQIIIVPASSGITTKADLAGKIVGLQKGSSSLDALLADPISSEVAQVMEYPDNISAYMDLKTGRIDVFVVDSVVGRYVIAQSEQ